MAAEPGGGRAGFGLLSPPEHSGPSALNTSIRLRPISRKKERITEELVKGSSWVQSGSCFDRTNQPRDAGVRPGTHLRNARGFRNVQLDTSLVANGTMVVSPTKYSEPDVSFIALSRHKSPSSFPRPLASVDVRSVPRL